MARAEHRKRLTDFQVTRIEPPAKGRKIVWDEEVKRLGVMSHASGRKVWKYIYPFHKRVRVVTIGDATTIPVENARKTAKRYEYQVSEGRDPAAERKAERNADTFGSLTDRFLTKAKTSTKASTFEHWEYLLDRFVLPKWRRRPLSLIARRDVIELLEPLEDRPSLHNQVRSVVHAVFGFGEQKDVVAANPVRGTKPCETVIKERILSDEELGAFWPQFDLVPDPIGTILKVMTLTGQRGIEVRHMRREHVKFAPGGAWWHMPGEADAEWPGTKNSTDHKVWLVPEVVELIGEGGGPVFPPVSRRQLARAMSKICQSLAAPRTTPHDLRKTFCSTGTGLGYATEVMDRLMNHLPPKLRRTYDQTNYSSQNKVVWERVASKLMAIINSTDTDDKVVVGAFGGARE